MDDISILEMIEKLALEAGQAVMDVYRNGFDVETKADSSPVTLADESSERIILAGLSKAVPHIPVVAEEAASAGIMPEDTGEAFFLVDPLDGTKEFINKRDDFTVNIALVRDGKPEIGVVYAPAKNALFSGRPGAAFACAVSNHEIVERRAATVRGNCATPMVVASRSHRSPETDEFLAKIEGAEIVSVGSSLKFCLIAAGEADLYPRFGPTMQWDTAAGDAVLRAAGGTTCTLDGDPLVYGPGARPGKDGFLNPWFIADGRNLPAAPSKV